MEGELRVYSDKDGDVMCVVMRWVRVHKVVISSLGCGESCGKWTMKYM